MLGNQLRAYRLEREQFESHCDTRKSEAVSDLQMLKQRAQRGVVNEMNTSKINQNAIELEVRKLEEQTALFVKQTTVWMNLYNDFQLSVENLGDVEGWSKSIQQDLTTIAGCIEYAHKTSADMKM